MLLLALLFPIYAVMMTMEAIEELEEGVIVGGEKLKY